jgi:hypothetical protein
VTRPVDAAAIRRFLEAISRQAGGPTTVYLVGGSTAVELGWRASTIDIDLRLEPEDDGILRGLSRIKIDQGVNVELASPLDFLPELPGWRDRSLFVASLGPLTIRHLDPYSQALAKLERGFTQDLADVEAMVDRGLVRPARLLELLTSIEANLYRFPAVDPGSLRAAVTELVGRRG